MRLNASWSGRRHVTAALLFFVACPAIGLAQSKAAPFDAVGLVEPEGGVLSIGTAATGVIERIGGDPGVRVRAGEELVKIDCAPFEASIKSLAGQALAARANADRVRNGPRPEEIAVGEVNVGVEQRQPHAPERIVPRLHVNICEL